MIVFQGLNLLSRIAYYVGQQQGIDVALMHNQAPKNLNPLDRDLISERWVLLNHYSLSHLHLPNDFGHPIYRLHTYTSHRGHFYPGFQVAASALDVPFLGKLCHIGALNELYKAPEPSQILEFDRDRPSWCSHHLHRPSETPTNMLGHARQIILKTHGDQHCAFQIFDWPCIMGFLPISPTQTVLVYSTSDLEKIDAPLKPDFESLLHHLLKNTPLRFDGVEKVGEAVPLVAYHTTSYRYQNLGLFGEATHKIHPLAGQGLNMGIADAVCLLELSTECPAHYELITEFEKHRWLNNAMIQNFCSQLSLSSARWWAPALFRAFNRSQIFKRKFFTYALQIQQEKIFEIIS